MEKTLNFNFEKETKGTLRFKEVVAENEEMVVGTLYVRKSALKEEKPEKLVVSIKSE